MGNRFNMTKLPKRFEILLKGFAWTLRKPKKRSSSLVIVGPFGPSCVGKTTVMRFIARRLPIVHIQNDAIRLFLRSRGIDENKYLYKYELIHRVAQMFLKLGFSVIIDANFATSHKHVKRAQQFAKQYGASFFLIRVVAPKQAVIKKLKQKRFLPVDRGGLLPDVETAVGHFLRSSKQFDYERLTPQALAIINASRPLAPQLKAPLRVLRSAMGLQ
jgi:predicted kinase